VEADTSVLQATGVRRLRIDWVVHGVFRSQQEGFTSEFASNRYRAIIPAEQLKIAGHSIDFVAAERWHWQPATRPDLIILGKILPLGNAHEFSALSQQVLKQVTRAIESGVPVIADFCDDHFDSLELGPHWVQVASLVTFCTAASEALADVVRRFTRNPVYVIPDPIASPRAPTKVFRPATGIARLLTRLAPRLGTKRLKLVWYGHPTNWPAMESWGVALEELSKRYPLVLWVVTKPTPRLLNWIEAFNARGSPSAIAEWVEWSEDAQWSYVLDADVVLLPSDPSDPRLSVKSNNRLTDALNSGRYVVASALPSYMPFNAYCSLTEDPGVALQWIVEHSEDALARVAGGQWLLRERFSVTAVTKEWSRAISDAIKSTADQKRFQ